MKVTVPAGLALALILSACAHAPAPNPGQFAGTAIRLRSTAEVCQHLQASRAAADEKSIAEAMQELRARNFTAATTEQALRRPSVGMRDNEVMCLWGRPAGLQKNLTADGAAQEVWSYTEKVMWPLQLTRTRQMLYFERGTLVEIGS